MFSSDDCSSCHIPNEDRPAVNSDVGWSSMHALQCLVLDTLPVSCNGSLVELTVLRDPSELVFDNSRPVQLSANLVSLLLLTDVKQIVYGRPLFNHLYQEAPLALPPLAGEKQIQMHTFLQFNCQ